MATIGKVSAVFSASTAGLRSGVSDAIRSFRQLGGEANALKNLFATMQGVAGSGVSLVGPAADVAAAKLGQFQRMAMLAQEALAAGRITAEQFASKMAMIGEAAERMAAAVSAGAAMTQRFETAEEQAARAVAEANSLLAQGVISQETHARAMAEATGAAAAERRQLDAVATGMNALAATMNEGAAVTRSVQTAEERHAGELQRLRGLLAAGAISQETYSRAVDRADDELRQASAASRGLGAATSAASSGVDRLAGKLNTLIAINAAQLFGQIAYAASNAARSVIRFAGDQAQAVDGTSKLSRRLGLTYGELSGLSLAGDLAGVSMDTIGKAATKADVAFVKAAQGSTQAQAALAGVGLSVDQLQNKSPAERFQMMADAIAGLPTPAERARASIALFGKSGADLLPLFEGGAGSIRNATDEAQRFGLALTDQQGQAVENMNDAFTRAYSAIQGVVQQVVAYLAPALQSVTDTFTNLVGGIGGANIGQFIGEGILAGAEFFATVADAIISGLSSVWEYVSSIGVQWSAVWEAGNRVGAFLSGVGNTMKFIFGAAILGLTGPITALLKGADFLAKRVGVDLGVDGFLAGADAFNQSIVDGMTDASNAAAADFGRAFGEGGAAAEAQKGPVSTMIGDAVKAAREAANARNEAARTVVPQAGPKPPPEQAAFTGPSSEALKGTDSRSREGIAEMFRLMRGDTGNVQEQQLAALQQIADNTSEADDMDTVDIGG